MSGFGRGGRGGHGRGGGGIAALRRGMPPKKNQNQLPSKPSGGYSGARNAESSSSSALEESFQLACAPQGSSQFAMMIKVTPLLLDELRRVEAEGGSSSMKFGMYPSDHLIKVGQEEFKFTSAPEPGELFDIFEEQKPGEDGQGVLAAVGSAWRKISVQRTLDATEKNRVKKLSAEAEQQQKSRKAIVLDSSSMKPEAPVSNDAFGRRPPGKTKKEPVIKKRKVTTTVVPGKSKPPTVHSTPVPPREKTAPATAPIADPVIPAAASPVSAPPPQSQPLQLPNQVIPEKRGLVEEITVGSSPQNKTVQKDKAPAVTTPEVLPKTSVGSLSMTDLRNSIIMILTENPRGLPIKQIEKFLGDGMPQQGRKNIEKILKSIAFYQAPGKYILLPGIKPEMAARPSPGSVSLPDAAAVDSPESPARAADSKDDDSDKAPVWDNTTVEVEKIDIGEEQSPYKSPAVANRIEGLQEAEEVQHTLEVDVVENQQVEDVNNQKAASSGSTSSSGSDSDSDSDSDSSSGSGTRTDSGTSSGSDSGSSSSEEDEDVDIVSEDENHKPKMKAEKKSKHDKSRASKSESDKQSSDDLHKDSEDVDIGDAEDNCKLDAVVGRITETIPLEVDVIHVSPQPDVNSNAEEAVQNMQDRKLPEAAYEVEEIDVGDHQSRQTQDETYRSPQVDRGYMPSPKKSKEPKSAEKASKKLRDDTESQNRNYEVLAPRSETSKHKVSSRSHMENRTNDSVPYNTEAQNLDSQQKRKRPSKGDVRPGKKNKDSRKDNQVRREIDVDPRLEVDRRADGLEKGEFKAETDSKGGSDLELGEFRETTPEQTIRKSTPEPIARRATPDSLVRKSTPELNVRRTPPEASIRSFSQDEKSRFEPDKRGFGRRLSPDTRRLEASTDMKRLEYGMDSRRLEAGTDSRKFGAGMDTRKWEAGMDARKWEAGLDTRKLEPGTDSRKQETGADARKFEAGVDTRKLEAGIESRKSEVGVTKRLGEETSRSKKSASTIYQHEMRNERVPPKGSKDRRGSPGMVPSDNAQPKTDVEANNKKAATKKGSSAEVKSKDNSADSIQSRKTEFFAPYEKEAAELRGPIKSYEQYMDYCREYREKHPVYLQLNHALEAERDSLQREMEVAKNSNDKSRLTSVYQKVTQDYLKRFKRMSKTFLLLHDELRTIKERCKEYARQC